MATAIPAGFNARQRREDIADLLSNNPAMQSHIKEKI